MQIKPKQNLKVNSKINHSAKASGTTAPRQSPSFSPMSAKDCLVSSKRCPVAVTNLNLEKEISIIQKLCGNWMHSQKELGKELEFESFRDFCTSTLPRTKYRYHIIDLINMLQCTNGSKVQQKTSRSWGYPCSTDQHRVFAKKRFSKDLLCQTLQVFDIGILRKRQTFALSTWQRHIQVQHSQDIKVDTKTVWTGSSRLVSGQKNDDQHIDYPNQPWFQKVF